MTSLVAGQFHRKTTGAAVGLMLAILAGCGGGGSDSETAVSASPDSTSTTATAGTPTAATPTASTPTAPAPVASTPTPAPSPSPGTTPSPSPTPDAGTTPAAPAQVSTVSGTLLWETFLSGPRDAVSATGYGSDGSQAHVDQDYVGDPVSPGVAYYSGGQTMPMLQISAGIGYDSAAGNTVILPTLFLSGTAVNTIGGLTLSRATPFAIDRSANYPTNTVLAEWRNGSDYAQLMVQTEDGSPWLRFCWLVQTSQVSRLPCLRVDPSIPLTPMGGHVRVKGLYIVDDSPTLGKRTWSSP